MSGWQLSEKRGWQMSQKGGWQMSQKRGWQMSGWHMYQHLFFFSSGNWDGILTHYALNVIMHVCRKGAYMEDTGPELCSDAPPDPLGQGLFSSPENDL